MVVIAPQLALSRPVLLLAVLRQLLLRLLLQLQYLRSPFLLRMLRLVIRNPVAPTAPTYPAPMTALDRVGGSSSVTRPSRFGDVRLHSTLAARGSRRDVRSVSVDRAVSWTPLPLSLVKP